MNSDPFEKFWIRLTTVQVFFWRNHLSVADVSVAAGAIIILSNYFHLSSSGNVNVSMPLGAQLATAFSGWLLCMSSPKLRIQVGQMMNEFIGFVSYFVALSAIMSVIVIFVIAVFGMQQAVRDLFFVDFNVSEREAKMLTALILTISAFLVLLVNTVRQNRKWRSEVVSRDGVIAVFLMISMGWLNLYAGFFQHTGFFVN